MSKKIIRREWIKKFTSMFSFSLLAPLVVAKTQKGTRTMPIVRISRGSFAPNDYEKVQLKLTESQKQLVPAIKNLNGLLHYYAGVDSVSNTMINVSVWQTLEAAKQMETLAPMLALAKDFTQIGVNFERPIINYHTVWEI
jgi:hypothetical protein